MADRTIVFTGFPGFIGGRLIGRLLADDPDATVVALVEPRMAERARSAAAKIDGERIEVHPGDITDPKLGLGDAGYKALAERTTSVHHLAAIYDLHVAAALAERVNVMGTQHVVDFCRAAPNLERHNYVSTAYVAGWRSGRVLEADLAAGQTFKNHYESTKFAAEVIVRGSMDEIPTTIYRPAIVVGDSKTGETQKFDGPYYSLRLIQVCEQMHMPIPQIGNGAAPFNVVPVDFVVEAIAAGARDEKAAGETFHLTDPEPVSSCELVNILAREYAGKETAYRIPPSMVERTMRVGPLRKMLGGAPPEAIPYLNHPVRFDTGRTVEMLGRHHLRCPLFPEYAPAMVRFFKEHQDDPAFAPAY